MDNIVFAAFYFIHFLFSLVLHGTRPNISLYADSLGASPMVIGLLVTSFALFPTFIAVQVGRWLDQYGARRMFFVGGIGIVISLITPLLHSDLTALFVSQVMIGVSHLFVVVSLQKTIGNLPGNRDRLIASLSLVGSLGSMVGPLASGYSYEHFGFGYTFFLASLIILFSLSLGIVVKKIHWVKMSILKLDDSQRKNSAWDLLRHTSLRNALLISGLVLYSKDVFTAYFPIYGSNLGLSPSQIGNLLALMSGMAVIVRLLQFYLVEKFGRGKVLVSTLLVGGIAFCMIPLTSNLVMLIVLILLLGLGLGLGQPLSLVYALNVSPLDRQGEVLGLRLTFNRGSQFIAPLLFGGVGSVFGLAPIFYMSGVILLIGAYGTRTTAAEKDQTNQLSNEENR